MSAGAEKEAAEIREKIRLREKWAERSEQAEALVKSPEWALVRTIVKEREDAFLAVIYSLPAEKFAQVRDVVQGSKSVVVEIEGYVGKRDEHLKEADRLRLHLENAEKAGRIRAVEVP